MQILLATQNTHKKNEIQAILENHRIILPEELGIAYSFEETESTYLLNAFGKAAHLYELQLNLSGVENLPVLADDSGLSVKELGGGPGIFSARYGSELKGKRLKAEERNAYLLSKMENVSDRRGFFVCCMVLYFHPYRFYVAQETLEGEITREPKGSGGFGYDPVFFLPAYGKTVAELDSKKKNEISHRGKAAHQIALLLDNLEA